MAKDTKFTFDKFINDIHQRKENAKSIEKKRLESEKDHPIRKYNKLYRERWQNSVRFKRREK